MKMFPRAAAMVAAALVGLTGLVGFSSPASATDATCTTLENARYEHTFNGPAGTAGITLTNGPLCAGLEQSFALVSYTTPSAKFALPQYVLDTSVKKFTAPTGAQQLTDSKLDFKVEVPQCFTQVDFVFGDKILSPLFEGGEFYNDRKVGSDKGEGSRSVPAANNPKQAWYNGGKGTCVSQPAAVALPDCNGNVKLTLTNRSTHSEKFVVTADGGFSETRELQASQAPVTVDVPKANARNIVVKSGTTVLWSGDWTKPADCQVPEIGKPTGTVTSDCAGLTFTVTNPKNGAVVNATFTPNKGAAQTITAQPGETRTVTFAGTEGLKVAVSGGLDVLNGGAAWTKPANCSTPATPATTSPSAGTPSASPSGTPSASTSPVETTPASGDGGGDGELPLTGSAAAGIAGGAFLLLVAGAVLYILARRRKVNFTA
jgi:LPXTG-motif cell wall-anchored protein